MRRLVEDAVARTDGLVSARGMGEVMRRMLESAALVWCLAATGLPTTVASQNRADAASLAVLGPGWADCEEVNLDVVGDDTLRSLFASWIQGYITGRNESAALRDIGAGIASSALLGAALRYCEEHPASKFSDATRDVYQQLIQHAQSAR
jgi:hypothetical protein